MNALLSVAIGSVVMKTCRQLIVRGAFAAMTLSLAACDENKLCGGKEQCCLVQTGTQSYVSACKATAEECSTMASTFPKSGSFPVENYPSHSADHTDGCK